MPKNKKPSGNTNKNISKNDNIDIFQKNKLGVPFNPKLYWEKAQDCYLKILTDIVHGTNLTNVPDFLKSQKTKPLLDQIKKYDPSNVGKLSAVQNLFKMFPEIANSAVNHPAFQTAMQQPTKIAFYTVGVMGVAKGAKGILNNKEGLKNTLKKGANQIQRVSAKVTTNLKNQQTTTWQKDSKTRDKNTTQNKTNKNTVQKTSSAKQSAPNQTSKAPKQDNKNEAKMKKESGKNTKKISNNQVQRVSAASKNKEGISGDNSNSKKQDLSRDKSTSLSSKSLTKVSNKNVAKDVNTIQRTSTAAKSSNQKTSKDAAKTTKKSVNKNNSRNKGLNM